MFRKGVGGEEGRAIDEVRGAMKVVVYEYRAGEGNRGGGRR